jgi:phage gp29-like protein
LPGRVNFKAATDETLDAQAADLLRSWLGRDELASELYGILDAIAKGYSVTEIIWDVTADQWLPKALKHRDPRFFELDRLGQELLLKTEQGPAPMAPYKYIVHRGQAKSGLPIRGGLARPAAWFYLFKNYDLKSWINFLEVFGLPLRLGKYLDSRKLYQ